MREEALYEVVGVGADTAVRSQTYISLERGNVPRASILLEDLDAAVANNTIMSGK